MQEEENTLQEMEKAIDEVEYKLKVLLGSYFVNYFKQEFLPKIKSIYKKLKKV